MESPEQRPLRVLFLCTQNSARSQIAEALLQKKGRNRFEVASAGADPASEVHPLAVETLREHGIAWSHARPKGFQTVLDQGWDLIITVCDRARENCPAFPNRPSFAHWSIPDPGAIEDAAQGRQAFRDALQYLSRRIDLMLALPSERLERSALEQRLKAVGHAEETCTGLHPL